MAVVTKVQINTQHVMKAGEFIEGDVNHVSVNAESQVKVSSLTEDVSPAQITADGGIKAAEFIEY